MAHKYDHIVALLTEAFAKIREAGLKDVLPKGGVGAILLAHKLEQELVAGDKGADARDNEGRLFEYKVSITDQFNFHFGGRKTHEQNSEVVRRHFVHIAGAYCALREAERFLRIVYCPSQSLVEHLCEHFARTDGPQINKNFRLDTFAALPQARVIL